LARESETLRNLMHGAAACMALSPVAVSSDEEPDPETANLKRGVDVITVEDREQREVKRPRQITLTALCGGASASSAVPLPSRRWRRDLLRPGPGGAHTSSKQRSSWTRRQLRLPASASPQWTPCLSQIHACLRRRTPHSACPSPSRRSGHWRRCRPCHHCVWYQRSGPWMTRQCCSTTSAQSKTTSAGPAKVPKTAKPRKAKTKRQPVPSFLFQENEQTEEVGPALGEVEVFMTVAGRQGKGGSVTRRASVEEMEKMVPVSFVPNLLPQPFADHLLRAFLQEASGWHTSKRWLHEREIESSRLESGFSFSDGLSSSRGFSKRWENGGFGDDLRHLRNLVSAAVQRSRVELRQRWRGTCPEEAQRPLSRHALAQETVALASRGQQLSPESIEWLVRYAGSYALKAWRWEPNFAVANLYKDKEDFLGAHSDPVESIGPWAIIASLTFGAARLFRMKPVGPIRAEGGRVTSFSVRLPHNSLLVCWEGFQEFWRHEVPKDNGLKCHPISGSSRLNFTFRKSVGSVAARKPFCHCGRKADLKPVLKASRNRGRYFWSCRNPRVKKGTYRTCDFFKWDDELVQAQEKAPLPNANSRLVEVPGSDSTRKASNS
ncbi:unnamed protein product, partial [Effrenium voratum]